VSVSIAKGEFFSFRPQRVRQTTILRMISAHRAAAREIRLTARPRRRWAAQARPRSSSRISRCSLMSVVTTSLRSACARRHAAAQ
jgi:hypothetical protein